MSSNLHLPTDDLKQQYIQRRGAELGVYLQALKSQDFETLALIGHRMRGNGVSFGFPELSVLGEKMEMAAQAKEVPKLRTLSIEFMNWVDKQSYGGNAR